MEMGQKWDILTHKKKGTIRYVFDYPIWMIWFVGMFDGMFNGMLVKTSDWFAVGPIVDGKTW